jgi:hypothetical protein
MDEQKSQHFFPRVPVSRELAPMPTDGPQELAELDYEELDERLAPGGGLFCIICKTAGWGC